LAAAAPDAERIDKKRKKEAGEFNDDKEESSKKLKSSFADGDNYITPAADTADKPNVIV
jgi:hypothetical protein